MLSTTGYASLHRARVPGRGSIDRREVFVFSQHSTLFGGSLEEAHFRKNSEDMDMAGKVIAPIDSLIDSGGARIREEVDSLAVRRRRTDNVTLPSEARHRPLSALHALESCEGKHPDCREGIAPLRGLPCLTRF